jgi:predicted DCC family thiol-disulfide oxidoreductase YuxK
MTNTKIILFDGVCNLCNGFVNFVIENDPEAIFKFANLQSEFAQALLVQHSIPHELDSVIYIENNQVYTKSAAAFNILRNLNIFKFVLIIEYLPKIITDTIYDCVAKNRYFLFGKSVECLLRNPSLDARFLS